MNGQKTMPPLPRRYEDTKPALNQAFTHGSILDIGHKLSMKSEEKRQREKEWEMKRMKQELWKKAEDYKDECVAQALDEAKIKEDKHLKRVRQEHEAEMKREVAHTEEVLVQRSVERCFEERVRGEKKLNDIVAKLYDNFAEEKKVAVESTRREEREVSEDKLEKAEERFRNNLQEQRSCDANETENKLEELRINMEEKCRVSVADAVNQEKSDGNAEIARISSEYEKHVADLKETIHDGNKRIWNLERELREMTELKDCYITKLQETRDAFVTFAEKCRPDFSAGQSDFIIPVNAVEPCDLK